VSVPAPSGWAGRVSNRRRAHHERCSDRLFYAHRSKPTIQTQTKQANTTAERSLYFTSATHQRPRRMGRYGCIGCFTFPLTIFQNTTTIGTRAPTLVFHFKAFVHGQGYSTT